MRVRKGLSFLVILSFAACVGLLWFHPAADSLSILRYGWGTRRYEAVGLGQDGMTAVAGREGERLWLVFGTLDGKRTAQWSASLSPAAAEGALARLYPVGENNVFLAVYEGDEADWEELAVYQVVRGQAPEALLRIPCVGDTAAQRRNSVQISSFFQENGQVCFSAAGPDGVKGYVCRADGGVMEREIRSTEALLSQPNMTYPTQAGAGLFYLDSAGLDVFYSGLAGTGAYKTARLGVNTPLEDATSLTLTGQGGAPLLLGGSRLVLDRGTDSVDLTGMLYRSPGACWALLLGAGLGLLLAAGLVWYGLEGRRTGQMSMAVRWGAVLLARAQTVSAVLLLGVIRPAQEENRRLAAENALSGAVSLAAPQWEGDAGRLAHSLAWALEHTCSGQYRDVTVRAYLPEGDRWILAAPALGMPAGARGELTGSFSGKLAQKAREEGMASRLENGRFELYLRGNLGLILLSVDGSALTGWMTRQERALEAALLAGVVLLTLLEMINLVVAARNMRKVAWGMEQLASGRCDTRVALRSGDELEGLASSLNSLARAMENQVQERKDLAQAYRRFVPERVLALLGKRSILDVDKSTLATRRMVVMMVQFSFPPQVYDGRMQEFFDSVNQVIERTAGVASRMGGTVFNFAYNGYDVVLEEGGALAVRTAVAVRQEMLALNESREEAGLPPAKLFIALDTGDVMVGVVGDESQMEPTTLSTSFTTVKRLIGLCTRLDAGILCTENIITGAKEYGSRYMGRSGQGEQSIRVYEIFEGDPYGVRRLKESTVGAFTQAVYALYSQDYVSAKRAFLELVHDGQADGGARYYLYLSDRLEKGSKEAISLD